MKAGGKGHKDVTLMFLNKLFYPFVPLLVPSSSFFLFSFFLFSFSSVVLMLKYPLQKRPVLVNDGILLQKITAENTEETAFLE